jgi:hypothetical protein
MPDSWTAWGEGEQHPQGGAGARRADQCSTQGATIGDARRGGLRIAIAVELEPGGVLRRRTGPGEALKHFARSAQSGSGRQRGAQPREATLELAQLGGGELLGREATPPHRTESVRG